MGAESETTRTVAAFLEHLDGVFLGKPRVTRLCLTALLADGHILLEDVPGTGKTLLARSMAQLIGGKFARIQFTPDMLPSEILGFSMYREPDRRFVFMPGPVFTNVLLADEINRTSPRTQSALLECMEERQVTVDGEAHLIEEPFFVIATQNPVEQHGVYPLPEAQLDRFLMRLRMGYPEPAVEDEILASQMHRHPIHDISYVVRSSDIVQCQALVRNVHVSDKVRNYIVTLSSETRRHPALQYGCSPRGSLALMRVAQARAVFQGRDYVVPADVRDVAVDVLGHRLPLKFQARTQWIDSAQVVSGILDSLPLSRWEKS